jgi:hypothetical protein
MKATVQQKSRGYLLVLILVFGAIFLSMVTAFISYIVTQHQAQVQKYNREQALNIAEGGLNYYKWFLAHNPTDLKNGTGLPGPYVQEFTDPEGAALGTYSLQVSSSSACGEMYAVDINSTGNTYAYPDAGRKVYGRYARPTIAEYAYIINSNVWAGPDRVITGPYHSNGGIRMDGTNNSTVTSGQGTWLCGSAYGCSPTMTRPGVFGSGPNSDLWSYPAAPINFTGITVDLSDMENKARNFGGHYLPPSGKAGYHITFKSNGTYDVYRVNSKQNEPNGYAWGFYMHILNGQTFLGNYPISSTCGVIFAEDQVWLDGVVKGRATIVAADVNTPGVDPSMILNGSITYADTNSGLLAIGEFDVTIGLVVPDDMTLKGIYIAQKGRFGRNFYDTSMPNAWEVYIKRNSLTMTGTIVSNGREGTKWINGAGTFLSGFNTRVNSYDRTLVSNPPPLTPKTSDEFQFIEWREVN